jgi:hypothetical protein
VQAGFGGANVGTAQGDRRRQAERQIGEGARRFAFLRMEQVGQRTGAVAQKQRDPVDLRGFLRLKRGQLRFGEAQVDMLAFEIEVVRQSALRPFGQNPGAFAQVVDVRAGHGKVALGTAQREIGLCHVAGEGQPRLIEKGALLGDVGIGRFDAASHLAPEVDFPRSVETALVERVGFPSSLARASRLAPPISSNRRVLAPNSLWRCPGLSRSH